MIETPEFVHECIERAGGLAEVREPGVVEAILPDSLRTAIGTGEVARLAVEPEAALRFPDAVPALPGSQALDALIQHAAVRGRVTHALPRAGPVRPRSIAGEVAHNLKFVVRRLRLPEGDAAVEQATMAQFDFTVSLISDERQESLMSVVVDLWSGMPCAALSRVAAGLEVSSGESASARRDRVSTREAFTTACGTLEAWMAPRIEGQQSLVTRRLRDEHGRLRVYYDGVIEDLERRVGRAGAGERAVGLREKVEAARLERRAKLDELSQKYRLRPSARLAAIRFLTYSRLFATVGLDRRRATRELEVCWDPLLGRLLLPGCDECQREARELTLSEDGRLRCPSCVSPALERAA